MLLPARTGDEIAARSVPIVSPRHVSASAWLLAGLTVVGAVIRLATLSKQSFWLDEALAARELHLSFGAMLSSIGPKEPNPPLFFVLAWPWAKLFGNSEAGIRSLSAVAGTAVIPLAYMSARQLVSRPAAVAAAAFTALSPFMIWYSQEAREYMLLSLFCSASFLFFARCWQRPSRRDLAWWTGFCALAVLTHFFAMFIVVPEALALLYRYRTRTTALALGLLVAVEAALLPHFLSHVSRPAGWIGSFPLSVRIKQVPVAFAVGNLDQGSALSYGLVGAAVLAAIVIALLVIGADERELRGAGLAASVAGVVIAVPLLLALTGHDYFVPRALIAAWTPLVVVLAAACTARRTRFAGAAVGFVALVAFVYAQAKIEGDQQYQRPDWRGVTAALGARSEPRAIVTYDGGFAAVPISLYLRGQALAPGSSASVAIGEIDIIGSPWQSTPTSLPGGVRLLATRRRGPYLVDRFTLPARVALTPAQISAHATQLLSPAPADAAIVVQP
jgi:mannosyltransferase